MSVIIEALQYYIFVTIIGELARNAATFFGGPDCTVVGAADRSNRRSAGAGASG